MTDAGYDLEFCRPWIQCRLGQLKQTCRDFLTSQEGGRFYALLGGPQSGKTVLLNSIQQDLTVNQRSLPVLIDLAEQVGALASPPDFFKLVFQEMRSQLGICYIAPEETARLFQDPRATLLDFKQAFGFIAQNPQSKVQGKRFALLLDNADGLAAAPFATELFNHLVTLFSNLTYITSVTRQLDIVLTGGVPLYNRLAETRFARRDQLQRYHLTVLPAEAVEALLATLPALTDQPALSQTIWRYTGGHPYLLHHFLGELAAQTAHAEPLTAELVKQIASASLDELSATGRWFHTCAQTLAAQGAQPIYAALAAGQPLAWPQIKEAIARQRLGDPAVWRDPAAVDRALDTLLFHGVIQTVPLAGATGYAVAGELFRRWFAANVPPPATAGHLEAGGRQPLTHFELQIRIGPQDLTTQVYPVEAWLKDGSHFEDGAFQPDEARFQTAENDPQEYGLILYDALFTGPILRAYDKATTCAETQTGGRLRFRLWVDDDAAELHALAWERLHHRVQGAAVPMAASAELPFSRYIDLERPEPSPIAERPIRLLLAVANPANLSQLNLAPLNVEQEITTLVEAWGDLQQSGQLQVTLLPGRTGLSEVMRAQLAGAGYRIQDGTTSTEALIRLLSQDAGYHVLHFVGHGTFSRQRQQALLIFENEAGNPAPVRDEQVATLLNSTGSQLRLVFLAACESARRDPTRGSPFVGLAPRLVQLGIPAVIAMQDRVSMALARRLAHDFYRFLLEHGSVDRALNQARLLAWNAGDPDWATPVLFMRLKEGQLFGAG